jgi:hypothetical protein
MDTYVRKRQLSPDAFAAMSKDRRGQLDVDELALKVERLTDEIKAVTDELTRCKDKSSRQLTYMEEENAKIRKTATDIKEKYVKCAKS